MTEIFIANNYNANAEEKVKELQKKLNGETFFNFFVDYSRIPCNGIMYFICADCEEDRKQEALEMAFAVIAEA